MLKPIGKWSIRAALILLALAVTAVAYLYFQAPPLDARYHGTENFRVVDCMVTPAGDQFNTMWIADKLYIVETEKGGCYPFWTNIPYWPGQNLGQLRDHLFIDGAFRLATTGTYLLSPETEEEAQRWCKAWSAYSTQCILKHRTRPMLEALRISRAKE